MAKSKKTKKKSSSPSKNAFRKLNFENEKEMALDFATKVHTKFDKMIKASILFGSQTKNTATHKSDIDVVLVIDDAAINWDQELIAWYREELAKIVSVQPYANRLHISTVKLTTWWNDLITGDPVIINMIRYGEVLIDSGGFFHPLKALLAQGKIKSTHEAVYVALQRAPNHLARSYRAQLSSIEGSYWCMVDAAQAALMTAGHLPPSPEHIPDLLDETFVKTKMMKSDAIKAIKELYSIHKGILYGQITNMKGEDIDSWQVRAEKFLKDCTDVIDQMLEASKHNLET